MCRVRKYNITNTYYLRKVSSEVLRVRAGNWKSESRADKKEAELSSMLLGAPNIEENGGLDSDDGEGGICSGSIDAFSITPIFFFSSSLELSCTCGPAFKHVTAGSGGIMNVAGVGRGLSTIKSL